MQQHDFYQDLLIFQLKLLSSITPNVPLDENLRAIMAPALHKLREFCRADVALHVFVNPEVHELHALVVGGSAQTLHTLEDEMARRHKPNYHDVVAAHPACALPDYLRLDWRSEAETRIILKESAEEYSEPISGQLLALLKKVAKERKSEFVKSQPREGDLAIVIPLGAGDYRRLGFVVLWSPASGLQDAYSNSGKREQRVGFRNCVEQLLVRVFTNFYQMEPQTYLPSFCKPATKPVTLLCAELRNFEGIAAILKHRHEIPKEKQTAILLSLVKRFANAAASVVEEHKGRVDQIWGNGLIAVFGEYLDTPEFSPKIGCHRAVAAAAEIVSRLERELRVWLENEFCIGDYMKHHSEDARIAPVVAINHTEIILDYVGSQRHRVYMSVGEGVDLVRRMASVAGGSRMVVGDGHARDGRVARAPAEPAVAEGPPILLSRSAYTWAASVLQPRPTETLEDLQRGWVITLPGLHANYSVHAIYPENVASTALGSL